MSAGDYPYVAHDQNCLLDQSTKVIASKVSAFGYLNDDPMSIAHDLYGWGPNVTYVAADNHCWRWYESGILSSNMGCPTSTDHAVTIVGLYTFFGLPYWKIQNSWGSGWGQDGFIYLFAEEGVGVSGMNTDAMWVLTDHANFPDRCRIDEWYSPVSGLSHCYDDLQCRGERFCFTINQDFGWSDTGYCVGEHNCEGINY